MAVTKLKAAILIISDTAFKDHTTDAVGVKLEHVFAAQDTLWDVKYTLIVPDDVNAIQQHIKLFSDHEDDYMSFVVTSGGTGFAIKDRTPEAIKPLIDKEAQGLVWVYVSFRCFGLTENTGMQCSLRR